MNGLIPNLRQDRIGEIRNPINSLSVSTFGIQQETMKDRKEYSAVVSHPFHVFNGIFLTLPLDGIRQTGLRVPLLQEACDEGLEDAKTPEQILKGFF